MTDSTENTRELDSEKLELLSKIKFRIETPQPSNPDKEEKFVIQPEIFDEISEDLTHLIKKMNELETLLKKLITRVDKVEENSTNQYKKHQIELDHLKRDLLGEKKANAVQSVFNTIVPAIDSLHTRKINLTPEKDALLYSQTVSIFDTLQNLIKSLGYESFTVETGEIFQPDKMECLGFEEGENDKVIRIDRPGYRTEYTVIRPCGVIIGRK